MVKELPIKAARDVSFSNGGHFFAAANGNTVHVWCSYTAAPLAVLRGHNGKVLSVGRQGNCLAAGVLLSACPPPCHLPTPKPGIPSTLASCTPPFLPLPPTGAGPVVVFRRLQSSHRRR